MSYQTLVTSLENSIFTITINRPDKLNALNKTVIEELSAAMEEVYTNMLSNLLSLPVQVKKRLLQERI
jgi:enoyl-CoA hydratase/carnithine racemase